MSMEDFEIQLIDKVKSRTTRLGLDEKFSFFWETRSVFSQWHKCEFRSNFIPLNNLSNDRFMQQESFSSAEQFMMVHKALLFNDFEKANEIMQTNDVRKQKMLGRQISNFVPDQWIKIRSFVVYQGNKKKFSKNDQLYSELIKTAGTSLVEAAPDDTIWGIGLVSSDPRSEQRNTWLGTNLLGEILTELRIELVGKY